jgi:calcineurin-like phosphoesterase
MTNDTIKILFFGDIVGRPGRFAVRDFLTKFQDKNNFDFILANVENASHGFGLTPKKL